MNHRFSFNTRPETLPKFLQAKSSMDCQSLSYIFFLWMHTLQSSHLFKQQIFFNGADLTHWGWGKMAANFANNTIRSIFLYKDCRVFYSNLIGICSQLSNNNQNNGLAPRTWQAIIWINAGIVYKCINSSIGLIMSYKLCTSKWR